VASTSGEAFPGLRKLAMLRFKFPKRVFAFVLIYVQHEEALAGADAYVGVGVSLPPLEDLSLISRGSFETVPVPRVFAGATAVRFTTGALSMIIN